MTGMELYNVADASTNTLSLTDLFFSSWTEGFGLSAQMFAASFNIFHASTNSRPYISHYDNDVRSRLSSSRSLSVNA